MGPAAEARPWPGGASLRVGAAPVDSALQLSVCSEPEPVASPPCVCVRAQWACWLRTAPRPGAPPGLCSLTASSTGWSLPPSTCLEWRPSISKVSRKKRILFSSLCGESESTDWALPPSTCLEWRPSTLEVSRKSTAFPTYSPCSVHSAALLVPAIPHLPLHSQAPCPCHS